MTAGRALGRVQSRIDTRTLKLAHYLERDRMPPPPPARDWTAKVAPTSWGLWRNDVLGDCTCASIAHLFIAQATNTGHMIDVHNADVVGLYERVGGYDPTRPETDRGAQMLDVLVALRKVGMAGQRVSAFAEIDPHNLHDIQIAVNLFGGVYVGADLPIAAQTQEVWDVARMGVHDPAYTPNSWGGHAMALLGYDRNFATFVTWGAVHHATLAWFHMYVSEAFVLIDPLWVDTGLSPSGFDLAALRADLVDLHRGAKGSPEP